MVKKRKNMEKTLLKIANTLIINAQHISSYGLLEGKMGIAIFFYHYSKINRWYKDFADDLLDDISTSLYKKMSDNIFDGLTGIGFGINYLIKNQFIDAEEDVLEDVEESLKNISLMDIISDIENESPFCSKGMYFIEKNDKEAIENILNVLNQFLNQNSEILPLSYLNSILYIFSQNNNQKEIPDELLCKLYENITNSINNKLYTFPDILLLTTIIEQILQNNNTTFDSKKWEELIKNLDYDNIDGIFNIGIYKLIFNKIKFNDTLILEKIKTVDIENQVNSMINDVYNNLNLYNGLAGVGLTLLRHEK